jgi:hypothetical protein
MTSFASVGWVFTSVKREMMAAVMVKKVGMNMIELKESSSQTL